MNPDQLQGIDNSRHQIGSPTVTDLLSMLGDNLDSLAKTIEELENRISPVLGEHPPEPQAETKTVSSEDCPLTERLASLLRHANRMREQVESITNRARV